MNDINNTLIQSVECEKTASVLSSLDDLPPVHLNWAALDVYLTFIERIKGAPPELAKLTTEEAAVFLRCSTKSLEARRLSGRSPRFQKQKDGAKVHYLLADLMSSVETRDNTIGGTK